ncbi:hypothetical protein [Rhodococcus sp. NCIMB 12038]|uniref:hypothetical protein n=1 Tax=Rhodococcus sp. NCIMB 12038 TaxID=933800 RepID=UPI0015C6872F|nr:hypothetical protein [Rhodococcus sp. NCIMB 12038]
MTIPVNVQKPTTAEAPGRGLPLAVIAEPFCGPGAASSPARGLRPVADGGVVAADPGQGGAHDLVPGRRLMPGA